jgi:hypothetical protein
MNNPTLYAKTRLLSFALFAFITGCVKDYSILAPPPDSEKVKIVMKVPAELVPKSLHAQYRSARCRMFVDLADVSRIPFPGLNLQTLKFTRRGETDFYEAEVFTNGGGECGWQLTNIEFGVTYRIPSSFGKRVATGIGGTVIINFDRQHSSYDGIDQVVEGPDLKIVKDYYPWVREAYVLGYYEKSVNLTNQYTGYRTYKAPEARNIYFEPVLHPDLVVTSTSPKKKVFDEVEITTFLYPDGTEESSVGLNPDVEKMQAIRLKINAK